MKETTEETSLKYDSNIPPRPDPILGIAIERPAKKSWSLKLFFETQSETFRLKLERQFWPTDEE